MDTMPAPPAIWPSPRASTASDLVSEKETSRDPLKIFFRDKIRELVPPVHWCEVQTPRLRRVCGPESRSSKPNKDQPTFSFLKTRSVLYLFPSLDQASAQG
jgi:hypothetical protein